jgi:hypothetical protein
MRKLFEYLTFEVRFKTGTSSIQSTIVYHYTTTSDMLDSAGNDGSNGKWKLGKSRLGPKWLHKLFVYVRPSKGDLLKQNAYPNNVEQYAKEH